MQAHPVWPQPDITRRESTRNRPLPRLRHIPGEEVARCHALDGHHRRHGAQALWPFCGPELERRQGAPAIVLHPADAEARGLREGNVARFWPKRAAGAANANATVAERDCDMGGGAVFHDNRVEVTARL